jgi:hypothetical protein
MAPLDFGIDPVESRRTDQPLDRGGPPATAFCSIEQVPAATYRHAVQRALRRRVIDLNAAVIVVATQGRPSSQGLLDHAVMPDLRDSFSSDSRSYRSN